MFGRGWAEQVQRNLPKRTSSESTPDMQYACHSAPETRRISSMLRQAVVVLAVLVVFGGIVRADWQQVQSIQPGEPILVQSGFVSDAGKFVSATADELVVETRAGNVTVPKADIDQVFVFRSRLDRINGGLIWGGVAAGATAGVLFPLAARMVRPSYATAATVTAINGTSIGLARFIGNRTKRIYRRKQ